MFFGISGTDEYTRKRKWQEKLTKKIYIVHYDFKLNIILSKHRGCMYDVLCTSVEGAAQQSCCLPACNHVNGLNTVVWVYVSGFKDWSADANLGFEAPGRTVSWGLKRCGELMFFILSISDVCLRWKAAGHAHDTHFKSLHLLHLLHCSIWEWRYSERIKAGMLRKD